MLNGIKDIKRKAGIGPAVIYGLIFVGIISCEKCPQVEIYSDKRQYYPYESISVTYEIRNAGIQRITNFDLFKQYFHITNARGNRYRCMLVMDCILADTLGPHEVYRGSEGIDSRYFLYDTGQYSCLLNFPGQELIPSCSHNLGSNTIEFAVTMPEGDELAALNLFKLADSLHYKADMDKKTRRQFAFEAYVHLADTYPNSIYAPRALYMALIIFQYSNNKDTIIGLCRRLIEQYPNSNYLAYGFLYYADSQKLLKDKGGAIEYLSYLIDNYPESKIEEKARYWLEKVHKWEF